MVSNYTGNVVEKRKKLKIHEWKKRKVPLKEEKGKNGRK